MHAWFNVFTYVFRSVLFFFFYYFVFTLLRCCWSDIASVLLGTIYAPAATRGALILVLYI
ncbi:hypothetical protein Hanom_Chr07g00679631 [Helianthus anomalus]